MGQGCTVSGHQLCVTTIYHKSLFGLWPTGKLLQYNLNTIHQESGQPWPRINFFFQEFLTVLPLTPGYICVMPAADVISHFFSGVCLPLSCLWSRRDGPVHCTLLGAAASSAWFMVTCRLVTWHGNAEKYQAFSGDACRYDEQEGLVCLPALHEVPLVQNWSWIVSADSRISVLCNE